MNSKIETILENNGVNITAMRMLVLEYLLQRKSALSLTDLENYFEKSDRTTLYRTIKTFKENGLVHQIDDGSGVTKYALCEENCECEIDTDLHLHFHCTKCEETSCLTDHKIPQINLPEGFTAENINLVVRGICDKCSKINAQ